MNMEVDRNPEPPKLNTKSIQLVTDLCFRKDDVLKQVDGLFVYSSIVGIDPLARVINNILSKKITDQLFVTGGFTPPALLEELGIRAGLTEAETVLNAIHVDQYKNLKVFVERESTNTLANVTETLKFPQFRDCKSLIFIFKSHAAGRGYLTLRKYFPDALILQQTFNTKYPRAAKEITRENWFTFDFGMKRVWGEFLRIKKYGSRGDIEYGEVRELVEEIEREIY